MNVIHYPDPRLMAKTHPLGPVTAEIRDKVEQMFDLMYKEGGVGLAAPQVAWSVRLFVMNSTGDRGKPEFQRVIINPRIQARRGRVVGPEGCLSFPGIFVDVERAHHVTVESTSLEGAGEQFDLEDFEARIFQHELDHLDAVLLVHRMTQADRIRNREAIEDLRRSYQPIA